MNDYRDFLIAERRRRVLSAIGAWLLVIFAGIGISFVGWLIVVIVLGAA